MAPKTRTKSGNTCLKHLAPKNTNASSTSTVSPPDANPPSLIVLPDTLSAQVRFITLCHPRTGAPTRYVHCPSTGLHEITAVKSAQELRGSWLVEDIGEQPDASTDRATECHILSESGFMTATPYDPLFLIIPALTNDRARSIFQSSEDLFEQGIDICKGDFNRLRTDRVLTSRIESRMRVICDSVEAGDQVVFRLNDLKLLQEFIRKASLIIAGGLPQAIESTFVSQPLEKPMSHDPGHSDSERQMTALGSETPELSRAPSSDWQSSSGTSIFSATSEADTSISSHSQQSESANMSIEGDCDLSIRNLLRLRTALTYLFTNYIDRYTQSRLEELMVSRQSPIDFGPLKRHLDEVRKLRAGQIASRSLIDYSLKRSFPGTEGSSEDDFERAEKKRQKEEQEKRKKLGESHGLKALKKVNVSGMKKMSSFFSKSTSKA